MLMLTLLICRQFDELVCFTVPHKKRKMCFCSLRLVMKGLDHNMHKIHCKLTTFTHSPA